MLVELGLRQRRDAVERWHRRMIGARPRRRGSGAALGLLGIASLGILFSLRPADPALADPVREARLEAAIGHQAAAADAELAALLTALQGALDEARDGAVATVGGEELPGGRFTAAAAAAAGAAPLLGAARDDLGQLAALLAARPGASAPALDLSADDLAALGAMLRSTAASADAFAGMRLATERVLSALHDALAALDDDDPTAAAAAVRQGTSALDEVRVWTDRLPTLKLWTDTSGALLDALARLAEARSAGDASEAEAASRAYATAAGGASVADRARALVISESGGEVTASALADAVDAVRAVEAARAAVADLVHP
jgi:hypothetical protein